MRNGFMTIIDAHGDVWSYDPGIVVDSLGQPIVAPANITDVRVAHGERVLAIDSDGVSWIYNLSTGLWRKGIVIDTLLPGESANTTNPWKKHVSVLTPAPTP